MFGTKKTLRDFWISHSKREFSISEIIFRTARKPNRFTTGEAFKKLKSMQAFAIFVKNENCKQNSLQNTRKSRYIRKKIIPDLEPSQTATMAPFCEKS